MTWSPYTMPMSSPLAARFRSERQFVRACVGDSVFMRRYREQLKRHIVLLARSFEESQIHFREPQPHRHSPARVRRNPNG